MKTVLSTSTFQEVALCSQKPKCMASSSSWWRCAGYGKDFHEESTTMSDDWYHQFFGVHTRECGDPGNGVDSRWWRTATHARFQAVCTLGIRIPSSSFSSILVLIFVYIRVRWLSLRPKSTNELTASDGASIATCGTVTMTLNLRLHHNFTWQFVVADVSKPIIGADFLSFHSLLVEVGNIGLLDELTQLTAPGQLVPFRGTHSQLRPAAPSAAIQCQTRHYIETMLGSPHLQETA